MAYDVDIDFPKLAAHISACDLDYQRGFPSIEKERLMRALLSAMPEEVKMTSGKHDFEKSLLKLRADGFRLIEMQSLEVVITSVWYRKSMSLIGFPKSEVVIALDWMALDEGRKEATTFRRWQIS